ncbi:prohibitin family protein [Cereibacter sphaeroides]|uniref:prohibitin family protein n=1 Tax=Cereibacter sphaeroides TaxID=1063 RepID=UPI001F28DB32|nr:prohibitin family protein [Cereibacter sphaeroides]MCE6959270.1 prohibitin family protein [Cereibacter sphaeroides]MCE6972862.1 prohibitin family protein [Cereibacter sphaeroides]
MNYRMPMEAEGGFELGSLAKKAGIAVVGVIALGILSGGFYTVDEGERGVILRNGAMIGTAEPGMSFKLPFFDAVRKISVKTNSRIYENVLSYSKDQQTADLRISLTYHIPPAEVGDVYATFGDEEGMATRLLDRKVNDEVKIVFGRYNAATAISDRGKMVAEMKDAVVKAVKGPVVVDSLQLENIDFSNAYETSIEERMKAEVEVAQFKQTLEREKVQAEILTTQAQAQADSRLKQAKADAEATKLRGEAEADAIRARAAALGQNPALIALTQAERWDGKLPATMIPDATVPFMNMGTAAAN